MPPRKRQKTKDHEIKPPQKVPRKTTLIEERKLLEDIYGVTFPDDLYQLWRFCSEINKTNPLKALSPSLGYNLVGPFEFLAKTIKADASNSINYHLHWRFYYDPPELMTLIVTDKTKKDLYHIGYLRDDPKDDNCIVVSNDGVNGTINIIGDSVFVHVYQRLYQEIQNARSEEKTYLQKLCSKLEQFADIHNINLKSTNNDNVDKRKKRVVSATFHGAGIVVPIDENEVGYRPVGETKSRLTKMFKKIDSAVDDDARMDAFDGIQETITYVHLANDECDFGMGLEFGMDMFSFGSKYLNKAAGRMLSMAYNLLNRDLYKKIIEHHLADRRKENLARLPEA